MRSEIIAKLNDCELITIKINKGEKIEYGKQKRIDFRGSFKTPK